MSVPQEPMDQAKSVYNADSGALSGSDAKSQRLSSLPKHKAQVRWKHLPAATYWLLTRPDQSHISCRGGGEMVTSRLFLDVLSIPELVKGRDETELRDPNN